MRLNATAGTNISLKRAAGSLQPVILQTSMETACKLTGSIFYFFFLLRWWRTIFHSISPTAHNSLTDTRRIGLLSSPLSTSLRTSGCRSGVAQTSDGLLVNPFDGQSRPDENNVQNSWVNQARIHLFFREEEQRVPQCSSFHILM